MKSLGGKDEETQETEAETLGGIARDLFGLDDLGPEAEAGLGALGDFLTSAMDLVSSKLSPDAKEALGAAAGAFDFSNVVIEPLFEEFVDFETFSKKIGRASCRERV